MQISRLEIFGFKSFMERLVLPIKGGITGVVGPNGCGKSNIVDALRWVLGETNARSLRGGLLEDVIFNGTDKLRPLGLAEVSLTISSEGNSLFDDIASSSKEGELQAQLEQADAQIKEVSSKLKKLQKEAEGKEDDGKSPLQSQPEDIGEAEEVVTSENDETIVIAHREAHQESEEITRQSPPKLRVIEGGELPVEEEAEQQSEEQSEEGADQPQEDTNPLISEQVLEQKFGWLKGVSEVQVTRRLYRSGEAEFFLNRTPCRLRDLKEFFRVIGISARTFTIVAQGEVSRIVTAKPEQRRQIFEEAAGVLGLRDKIAASERRLKDTADNIARLEDIEREVERQVNSLKRQANRARRREALKDDLYSSERSYLVEKLRRIHVRQEELSGTVAQLQAEEETIVQGPEGATANEEALRSELLQTEILVEELREKLDALKEEANERGRREESLKGAQHELKMLFEAKGTEEQRVTERLHTLLERRSASTTRIAELSTKESQLQEKLEELETGSNERLHRLNEELRDLRQSVRVKEEESQETRDRLRTIEGELEATKKQLRDQSRHELLDHEESGELKAILQRVEGELPKVLAELFEVDARYTKAIQTALGEKVSYFVVSNAAEIAESFEQYARDLSTGDADKASFWYGVLEASNIRTHSGPSVSPDHSQAVPAIELVDADSQVMPLLQNLLAGVFVVASVEDGLRLFRNRSIPSDVLIVTEAGERFTANEIALPQLERGLLDIQREITQLTEDKAELAERFEQVSQNIARQREDIQQKEQEHSEALRQKQEQEQAVRELNKELGSVRGYLNAEQQSLEQTEQDISRSKEYETELQTRVRELEENRKSVESELQQLLREDSSDLHTELRQLAEQLHSKDSERRSLRERFEEARSLAEAERRSLDQLRQNLSTKKLGLERANMEAEHVEESIRERLPAEYQEGMLEAVRNAQALPEEEFSSLEEQVSKIRAQLLREGEVDPSSIQQFEEESARLEELKAQKADLESASHTLQRTVKLLREQSITRFIETFDQVRERFIKLMPRLFGGGSADLELVNTDDPLESGIHVTVRPPGKKPKSLDLLSGGEKALTATALIVSLFLVRPSPLCVLDEVDAPLDEANLVRFLSLVKEMSEHTQFLLITHNKASMTAADRLVGVTMQKPGASSVLTVSLEEAYSHVA